MFGYFFKSCLAVIRESEFPILIILKEIARQGKRQGSVERRIKTNIEAIDCGSTFLSVVESLVVLGRESSPVK